MIQKDDGFARDRNVQRERQFSKYYGHEFKCLDTPTTPPYPSSPPPAPQRERVEEKRPSDRMSTMLNIRSETMNAINSHRAMTFESNFNIQAASRHS